MKRTWIIVILVNLFLASWTTDSQKQHLSTNAMTQQHQDSVKQWIHTYIDEIWNKRDFSKADTYWGQISKMYLLLNFLLVPML